MRLAFIDWLIIAAFFAVSLAIGLAVYRRASSSMSEFFLSGRHMPWWLLGVSMVATTFAADTPALVADIVRNNGVAGNWVWWAFLLTGMLTVFVYAKLWRRARLTTDLEFYELRYSGKPAAFLRGFRALYLGVFFNVMIMATVSLAAIKIGGVLLDLSPAQTLIIAGVVTVLYSSLGGFTGVLLTDFFQFGMAMLGSVWAAVYIVGMPEVGGMEVLMNHEVVSTKLAMLPDFGNWDLLVPLFILPLAVQWWSVWYPGSEPGGGGYIAQRMLAAKSEREAMAATLFFNVAHYAVRPWPWIIIALASIIVFPDIASLQEAFPAIDAGIVRDDLAYFAMLSYLPAGLLGLVVASLIAAFMSTISTHLNWGSSYVVNDFYLRFVKPDASEADLVRMGRISTVTLMVLSGFLALALSNALQAFNILLSIGAGTGLIFILRWFWWRINAFTEIAGMVISFLVAIYLQLVHPALGYEPLSTASSLLLGITITTIGWVAITYLTPPTDEATLRHFYRVVRPAGKGWDPVVARARAEGDPIEHADAGELPLEILCMLVGTFTVYFTLFAVGYWVYGRVVGAMVLTVLAVAAAYYLFRLWGRLKTSVADEAHEVMPDTA
ncbi:MAG TPA: Na+:solute symporter [Amaricoccus sp.]|uniref:sodium:solute symporter family protein n=1 Tax=Amaricoccus sp. TaxID=1872485 RepID=UPI002C6E7952|nr:sodium:solute symporter family protein [Amaricoccus sp.]HMQ93690.1 Na+:solute symporter [Amaricoccus sp.]HMR52721.1 Na+:solute symporter [Amaricoccus sp.]HMR59957.1 Na+:solute symporter [Amaricoccus sp.]HMT99648.1 Na+:solute symporter [Amaricoccus sp.]